MMNLLLRWKRENNDIMSYCYIEKKSCIGWVEIYFSDCLCNFADQLSFGFGLVSVFAWAIAEIPQIVTNYQTKTSHGLCIFFLIAWIAGDLFNLAGCLLEPATLPTQLYTAVFYTGTTLVLVVQSLYYNYVYTWLKRRGRGTKVAQQEDEDEVKTALNPNNSSRGDEERGGRGGIPIPSKDFYYTSARSLAGSSTPPNRSYMSGPSSTMDHHHSSLPAVRTQSRSIPPVVGHGAFLATAFSFIGQSHAMGEGNGEYSEYGQLLGWLMAALYMGGRIPQICRNAKRGTTEGSNPLMFIFALLGNTTYVASILVRNSEWNKIKANLPWLLDAAVCVMLDLFITMQYVYYRHLRKKDFDGKEGEEEYYVEVDPKASVA